MPHYYYSEFEFELTCADIHEAVELTLSVVEQFKLGSTPDLRVDVSSVTLVPKGDGAWLVYTEAHINSVDEIQSAGDLTIRLGDVYDRSRTIKRMGGAHNAR